MSERGREMGKVPCGTCYGDDEFWLGIGTIDQISGKTEMELMWIGSRGSFLFKMDMVQRARVRR